MSEDDVLLTEQQVSEMTQISVRTLQRWRAQGTGPAWVRVHRFVRYRKREVEEWLRQGNQRPPEDP